MRRLNDYADADVQNTSCNPNPTPIKRYIYNLFNESEAVAVLAPHHPEHQFVLFVQPKEREKEIWTGYRCGVEGAKEL